MGELQGTTTRAAAPHLVPWSSLWRGAAFALCVIFAFSTQLLFAFNLYESWPFADILLGWLDHLLDQLIVGGCVFAAIALSSLAPAASGVKKHAFVLAAIAVAAVAGEALLMVRLPLPDGVSVPVVLFAKSARWFAIGALGYAFYVLRRQAAEAAAQAHESDLQRVRIDRQMTEARLQYLRAYIEPHFLFNTLANVHRLYRTEPERGRAMLAHFIAYLRAVLPQMRQGDTTLKQDIELARAYLGVLQVRMGERLSVSFDVPDDIAALPFPPLALATLTENAIKHGLNPMPEGGAIEINARLRNGQLVVQVADTGAGFRGESGTGSGLANLRARLAALYGDAARLDFEANRPRGLRATIAVPVRRAAEAA
jgi:signal transduction histidine kinase